MPARIIKLTLVILTLLSASISFAAEKIKIASWNIQNFGESKAEDDSKMAIITDVISRFDIIAVQEISNLYEKSDDSCPRNEDACPGNNKCDLIINALKKHLSQHADKDYRFMLSPHVKDERYLYIYDKKKIDVIADGELIEDQGDSPNTPICSSKSKGDMVRQPFYATFIAGDFTFTLVTAHTQPSNNKKELGALEKYYRSIQNMDSDQKDVILLGDLNADCAYLPKNDVIALKKSKYIWAIDDDADTTVRSSTDCAYDRIIFTAATKEDYTGKHEVYQFDKDLGMTKQTALKISDHYPVSAEFYTDRDTD